MYCIDYFLLSELPPLVTWRHNSDTVYMVHSLYSLGQGCLQYFEA